MAIELCAKCGHERRAHSYNGACYGICGEFVESAPDVLDEEELETILAIARNKQIGRLIEREVKLLVAAYRNQSANKAGSMTASGLKGMTHDDQHREAIASSVRAINEVTTTIFDDKVKPLGRIKVSAGTITINLDYPLGMISEEATRDFLMDSIRLGLEACYDKMPEAFDPFAK